MSKNNKGGSRFNIFSTLAIIVLFGLGLWNLFKSIFDKDNDSRMLFALILCGSAIVLAFVIPLLPAKLRGGNKVPFKVRLLQILESLFSLTGVGGLAAMFYFTVQEPKNNNAALMGGGVFVLGFAIAVAVNKIMDKLIDRGEADPEDRLLFGSEEEDRYKDMVYKNPEFYGEDGLSDEERERELKRIEGQDDSSMNKAQVELHENLKDLKFK